MSNKEVIMEVMHLLRTGKINRWTTNKEVFDMVLKEETRLKELKRVAEVLDRYGRDCKHGKMFPLLLLMTKAQDCPNFERKTTEQIKEQLYGSKSN